MLVSTDFPTCAVTASSALATHAAANVQSILNPYRTWQASQNTVDAWIRCDFGSAVSLDGVFLNVGNVLSVVLQRSIDGTNFTDVATYGWPVDRRVNRRKAYLRMSGFNYRYLRVLFPVTGLLAVGQPFLETTFGELEFQDSSPGDGGTFEVGVVAPVGSVTVLSEFTPLRPLVYVRRGGHDVVDFVSGGFEVEDNGPPYLEATFNFQGRKTEDGGVAAGGGPIGTQGIGEAPLGGGGFAGTVGGLPQMRALQDVTIGQPLLVSEELGNVAHAYVFRRIDASDEREDFSVISRGGWALREAI